MSKKKKTKSLPVKKSALLQRKISKPSAEKPSWTELKKVCDSISDRVSVIDIQSHLILFSNKNSGMPGFLFPIALQLNRQD